MKILKKYTNGGTTEKIYDKEGNLIVEEKEKRKRKLKRKYDKHGNLKKEKYKSKGDRKKPVVISKEKRDIIKDFLKEKFQKEKSKEETLTDPVKDESEKSTDDVQDTKIDHDKNLKKIPERTKERRDYYDEHNLRYDETIEGYDKDGNPLKGTIDETPGDPPYKDLIRTKPRLLKGSKEFKKGGMVRKGKKGKKGPLGAMIKEIWRGLPPGVKAGVIGTGAGLAYSGVRRLFTRCKTTNTGRRRCKPRKIKFLDF